MRVKFSIALLFFGIFTSIQSQENLSKEEALAIALEQNFGILISRNTTEIEKNNRYIMLLHAS